MNTIEDRLRDHFAGKAEATTSRDWSAEIISRGRRLQSRRRVALGVTAAVAAIALGWGALQVPGLGGPAPTEHYVAAADLPPQVRSSREAAIAGYLEQHKQFAWIADTGGRIVCATEELGEQERADGKLRVFVWALCASRGGTPLQSGTSVPLAIDLDANAVPTGLLAPGDGAMYSKSIKANFPRELWDDVFDNHIDIRRLERDLDKRAKAPK